MALELINALARSQNERSAKKSIVLLCPYNGYADTEV